MAEKSKTSDKSKVEKKAKKSSKDGKPAREKKSQTAPSAFTLLADTKTVDPSLSSLFAVKQPPVKPIPRPIERKCAAAEKSDDEDNDAELSELDDDDGALDDEEAPGPEADASALEEVATSRIALPDEQNDGTKSKRKRKRKDADEELEDAYMSRLAREEEKDAERLAAERTAKRQKSDVEVKVDAEEAGESEEDADEVDEENDSVMDEDDEEEDLAPQPLKHETEIAADEELSKANRTVFLGNVSTDAISSKSSRKTLTNHLGSFFSKLSKPKDGDARYTVESIRFRSTPYASAIPKKAAFAKKALMDATTKSTNAYVVYSSPLLAREASKRLNGTVVLGRHLRVDEVAHPAKVENRRCVFVGNLGFVDDESNIQQANEEEGREVRKRGKEPGDVEEGLWRTFGKCGKVESVRVIRDSTTRVGKGIAYVQFDDENAVEAALLLNEKKFPPMLPRKLRVSRAKAVKRNAKPGSGRPTSKPGAGSGYQRKITGEEASKLGRAGKLLGKAAAAQVHNTRTSRPAREARQQASLGDGIRKPESFIFEGHRATARQGKSGLKLGGKAAGKAKGKSKVTKRSASFKKKPSS